MPDFCNTEDGWKTVFGLRANERQGVPVAFEDMLESTVRDEPPLGLARLCTIQDLPLFPCRALDFLDGVKPTLYLVAYDDTVRSQAAEVIRQQGRDTT